MLSCRGLPQPHKLSSPLLRIQRFERFSFTPWGRLEYSLICSIYCQILFKHKLVYVTRQARFSLVIGWIGFASKYSSSINWHMSHSEPDFHLWLDELGLHTTMISAIDWGVKYRDSIKNQSSNGLILHRWFNCAPGPLKYTIYTALGKCFGSECCFFLHVKHSGKISIVSALAIVQCQVTGDEALYHWALKYAWTILENICEWGHQGYRDQNQGTDLLTILNKISHRGSSYAKNGDSSKKGSESIAKKLLLTCTFQDSEWLIMSMLKKKKKKEWWKGLTYSVMMCLLCQ